MSAEHLRCAACLLGCTECLIGQVVDRISSAVWMAKKNFVAFCV